MSGQSPTHNGRARPANGYGESPYDDRASTSTSITVATLALLHASAGPTADVGSRRTTTHPQPTANTAARQVRATARSRSAIASFTVLAAFPLGFLITRRQTALLSYLIVGSFLFSLQSLSLLLNWMSGGSGLGGGSGFGDTPTGSFPIDYANSEVIAYGVVNAIITVIGVGLVLLGARVRARRQTPNAHDVVDVH